MISLKKRDQGFTIVELLIVIVVIGILALLVITTYSGIQQKARNNTRQANLGAIQTQLEIYYQNNGFYPSLAHMQTGASASTSAIATWVKTNLKNLDQNALVDPGGNGSHYLQGTPTAKYYSYEVTQADGTTSCASDETTCAAYTLTATYEGQVNGQSTVTKSNLD